MATLKICTQSRTRWIPDVRSVERLATFETHEDYRNIQGADHKISLKQRRQKEETIFFAAIEVCPDDMAAGIQILEFFDEETGMVLRVTQHGSEDKIYLVPEGGTYLMSDQGKTIDRI